MKVIDLEIDELHKKINKDNIFIGNIKICTSYEEKKYIENQTNECVMYNSKIYLIDQILVKMSNNPETYMIIDAFEKLIDNMNSNENIEKNKLEELIFPTSVNGLGSLWVDPKSLKPYYKKEKGKIKVNKVERELPVKRWK